MVYSCARVCPVRAELLTPVRVRKLDWCGVVIRPLTLFCDSFVVSSTHEPALALMWCDTYRIHPSIHPQPYPRPRSYPFLSYIAYRALALELDLQLDLRGVAPRHQPADSSQLGSTQPHHFRPKFLSTPER